MANTLIQLKNINKKLAEIEKIKSVISVKRDELRDALSDLEGLLESLEDGLQSINSGLREIENGVDTLSQYV